MTQLPCDAQKTYFTSKKVIKYWGSAFSLNAVGPCNVLYYDIKLVLRIHISQHLVSTKHVTLKREALCVTSTICHFTKPQMLVDCSVLLTLRYSQTLLLSLMTNVLWLLSLSYEFLWKQLFSLMLDIIGADGV